MRVYKYNIFFPLVVAVYGVYTYSTVPVTARAVIPCR